MASRREGWVPEALNVIPPSMLSWSPSRVVANTRREFPGSTSRSAAASTEPGCQVAPSSSLRMTMPSVESRP
ncbi:hypothetical protein BJF90_35160 [Pseudonocardia sp. CNS-004]|nr:hypothetical protein BJF90_35160 [Pseudonocardia sp. CNS-004]